MSSKVDRARYMREWLARSPENRKKNVQRATQWRADNLSRAQINKRRRDLKARYGMTIQEWDALFDLQGRQCAICLSATPGPKGRWHTDHCHATGRVRGILCAKCNFMIGAAQDAPYVLRRAADYVVKGC